MKFNKWTLGLAALGVVSLASAAKADEKQNFLQTALSSTTISGYVDTSVEWSLHPWNEDNSFNGFGSIPFRGGKRDGFNLNVVKLSIEKPLDESEWAAGYKVDLLFGPDAVGYNTSANAIGGQNVNGGSLAGINGGSDFGIKQAYVALRVPIGNGIEFKVGTFDTIIGYEVFEAGNNPNFSRSWGYAIEPTQHTGILAAYRVNDVISISAGVANTLIPGINARNVENSGENYWCKTLMGSIALTAPESWGWAAGSSLYGGVVYGFGDTRVNFPGVVSPIVAGASDSQANYYAGLTLNTPVAGLKVGAAFDHMSDRLSFTPAIPGPFALASDSADVVGLYASYQATEKLSLHARGELGWLESDTIGAATSTDNDIMSLTGTVQYDLWQNVISRLELRWDEVCVDNNPGAGSDSNQGLSLYANIIYKF